MRNILDHPITRGEVIQALDDAATDLFDEEVIGDVRPICLKIAASIIKTIPQKTWDEAETIVNARLYGKAE